MPEKGSSFCLYHQPRKATDDIINKPNHYHKGGIDVYTYLNGKLSQEQLEAIHQFNILKYVTRYKEKNGLQDLHKAKYSLDKLIQILEGGKENAAK
jgi:hypothetical protein